MPIEIEVSPKVLFALFDSQNIGPGMTKEVPGGATIRIGEMFSERQHASGIEASLIPLFISFGSGVASQVVGSWLYDKLSGNGKGRRMIRVNRKTMVEVTPEALTRVVTESIEIDEK